MGDNGNIFTLHNGAKDEKEIPSNDYVIIDIDGDEYYASGFMIFTSQHIAVMQDQGNGAIPVFVLPLAQLKVAELYEDDEVSEQLPGG